MKTSIDGISKHEFTQARNWLNESPSTLPPHIHQILDKLLFGYDVFAHNKGNQRDTLMQLRLAMGIIPKSEKGKFENK